VGARVAALRPIPPAHHLHHPCPPSDQPEIRSWLEDMEPPPIVSYVDPAWSSEMLIGAGRVAGRRAGAVLAEITLDPGLDN